MKEKNNEISKELRINLRVSNKDEIEKLEKIFQMSGKINKSEVLRSLIFSRPIKVQKIDNSKNMQNALLSELKYQVRMIGLNINQIVKIVNSDKHSEYTDKGVRIIQKDVEEIKKLFENICKKIS